MSITGKTIRAKRQAQKLTQQDLADKMNLRVRTIQRWEDDETKVPRNKEEKLMRILSGENDKLHDIDEFVLYLPKADLLKMAEGAKEVKIIIRLT